MTLENHKYEYYTNLSTIERYTIIFSVFKKSQSMNASC